MAKYRKKALTEFVPYEKGMEDGFKPEDECYKEYGADLDGCSTQESKGCTRCCCYKPYIRTLEGKMTISSGDYIGTGVQGERYPIKPDILVATYEKVEE